STGRPTHAGVAGGGGGGPPPGGGWRGRSGGQRRGVFQGRGGPFGGWGDDPPRPPGRAAGNDGAEAYRAGGGWGTHARGCAVLLGKEVPFLEHGFEPTPRSPAESPGPFLALYA